MFEAIEFDTLANAENVASALEQFFDTAKYDSDTKTIKVTNNNSVYVYKKGTVFVKQGNRVLTMNKDQFNAAYVEVQQAPDIAALEKRIAKLEGKNSEQQAT